MFSVFNLEVYISIVFIFRDLKLNHRQILVGDPTKKIIALAPSPQNNG